MKSLLRVTAGTNERRFRELVQRASGLTLLGKRRFFSGDVEISVDESLEYKGTQYLIEVDSANMAKLIVGQYVLLNLLHTQRTHPQFFLVIHTYKKFNPMRTVHNLDLVNQQMYQGKGIEFGALHFDQLQHWQGDFDELLALACRPPPNITPCFPSQLSLPSTVTSL